MGACVDPPLSIFLPLLSRLSQATTPCRLPGTLWACLIPGAIPGDTLGLIPGAIPGDTLGLIPGTIPGTLWA
jgi:hypothetical protein